MRGPRRKRYLLLRSEVPISEATRKELSRLISERYPHLARKAVWSENAVIVKTDNQELAEVRAALELSVDGVRLKSTLASGSIGKLKKAAST